MHTTLIYTHDRKEFRYGLSSGRSLLSLCIKNRVSHLFFFFFFTVSLAPTHSRSTDSEPAAIVSPGSLGKGTDCEHSRLSNLVSSVGLQVEYREMPSHWGVHSGWSRVHTYTHPLTHSLVCSSCCRSTTTAPCDIPFECSTLSRISSIRTVAIPFPWHRIRWSDEHKSIILTRDKCAAPEPQHKRDQSIFSDASTCRIYVYYTCIYVYISTYVHRWWLRPPWSNISPVVGGGLVPDIMKWMGSTAWAELNCRFCLLCPVDDDSIHLHNPIGHPKIIPHSHTIETHPAR